MPSTGCPPRNARIVRTIESPGRRRNADREPEEAVRRLGRQGLAAKPRPHRAREARVVHRAVPARRHADRRVRRARARRRREHPIVDRCCCARTPRATSSRWSVAPRRPVMFATSMRQPSRSYGGSSQRRTTEVDRRTCARAALRIRSRASAARARRTSTRSRARSALVEVEEPALGLVPLLGGDEPVVPRADVVGREVSEHADPPRMCRADERDEGVVAPEQRVDTVERGRVVAVRAPGGEHRSEVEDVRRRATRGGRVAPRRPAGRRRTTRTAFRAHVLSEARPSRAGSPTRAA